MNTHQATPPADHGRRIDLAILELNLAIHERYGSAISVDTSALDRSVAANAERIRQFRRDLTGVPVRDVMRREEAARLVLEDVA